jgi:Transglycosylase SLT domain
MIFRAAFILLLLIQAARADPPTDPVAAGRIRYAALLNRATAQYSLPSALADAVATVESAYEPEARGAAGEVGLMQVRPSTAAMLGFRGSLEQLADPATNIQLGVKYLAGAWQATGGRLCDTLMKYRAGYGEDSMSLRSVIYCRRARDYLASIGSPLATGPGAEIPTITPAMLPADATLNRSPGAGVPMFLTPAAMIRLRHGKLTAEDTRRYWIAEKVYIRALRSRLELTCHALHKRRVCPFVITRLM